MLKSAKRKLLLPKPPIRPKFPIQINKVGFDI